MYFVHRMLLSTLLALARIVIISSLKMVLYYIFKFQLAELIV